MSALLCLTWGPNFVFVNLEISDVANLLQYFFKSRSGAHSEDVELSAGKVDLKIHKKIIKMSKFYSLIVLFLLFYLRSVKDKGGIGIVSLHKLALRD